MFDWKETTPSQYAVIVWLIILGMFGAALVAEEPSQRIIWLTIGADTMVGRIIFVRLTR